MRLYQDKLMLVLIALVLVFLSFVVILDNSLNFNNSKNDHITGDVVNTHVELFPIQSKNCSFHLNPGWNMVSFYCLGLYVPRESVLDSISGSYSSIFAYQANDVSDKWKSYNPDLPNWTVQQLNHMDRVSGYWIYIYNESNFSFAGVYSDSNINLYDGWNFVGYPNKNTVNINISLNGIPYTLVKHYNVDVSYVNVTTYIIDNITGNITGNITNTVTYTSDTWLIHVFNGSNNTLDTFDTYRGYWLNVTGDSVWHIVR